MQRGLIIWLLFAWINVTPVAAADKPISPERAAARMRVPEGFRVQLVAGEPTLIKPMAMATDDRGRLWVVESHSYPHWKTDGKNGSDRILILEEKRGTGKFSCKVFWNQGTNLSGIALGFGGVWLCATPKLIFIPLKPNEDKPAGPPVVVLDGWDLKAKHNVFNALKWGPDGWLYGCNGILSESRVGPPGTRDADRVHLNCGVWRYHPIKKRFEVVASGTTNPWGLDFDEYGELFITNCVIKHLFHVIPGGHYERMFGQDLTANCFRLLESCADHIHWAGGHWTTARGQKEHDQSGGGHAHAGALVYLGDNWPAMYRGRILMANIHGNRLNQDVLIRKGSGYLAKHGSDFLHARDTWFRGLGLCAAQDGGVFSSDWHDTGECHNYDKVHASGRVYKITFGRPAHVAIDLTKLADDKLVQLQTHKNDWQVRHARRLLQERAAAGKIGKKAAHQLLALFAKQPDTPRKLRALWALHVIGALDEKILLSLLDHKAETIRGWAVRLLLEDKKISAPALARLTKLARHEKSVRVRLALAAALQRLSLDDRWNVAESLLAYEEDAMDGNLPLMLWYGIEPLVPYKPILAADFIAEGKIPLVRQYVARRLALMLGQKEDSALEPLVGVLDFSADPDIHRDILRGMIEALQGRRDLKPPKGWSDIHRKLSKSKIAEVRDKVRMLSVMFGDAKAIAQLRQMIVDVKANPAERGRAIEILVENRARDLLPVLQKLLGERAIRAAVLRGLAAYNDSQTPTLILKYYRSFTDAEKADAVHSLASRPVYAMALLDAMKKGTVARRDLSPFLARQLLGFNDNRLTQQLNQVWGSIRQTAKDRVVLMARYKALVTPAALKKADRAQGRLVFQRTCATCHVLFDAGAKIGPDLTGSQRISPEYILTKVVDPNAVVARDYQVTRIITSTGRVLNGIIKEETDKTLALQTPNELLRLAKADIDDRKQLTVSMMPEGMLAQLTDREIRDLLAYLSGPGQVALPKSKTIRNK